MLQHAPRGKTELSTATFAERLLPQRHNADICAEVDGDEPGQRHNADMCAEVDA